MYLPDKMCCRCSLSPLSICCLSLSEFRENKAFQSFLFTYYIIQIKDISQSRDEMEDGDDSSPHSVKYSNHFSIYCSHHQQQHTRDQWKKGKNDEEWCTFIRRDLSRKGPVIGWVYDVATTPLLGSEAPKPHN